MQQRTMPRTIYMLLCALLIVAATFVTFRIATTTVFDVHPDEYNHADAFCYYESEWWPPPLNADNLRYSPWGMSRLHEEEIVYIIFGKISIFLRPLIEPWFDLPSEPVVARPNTTYLPFIGAPDLCFIAYHTYRFLNVALLIGTLALLFWMGRRYRWATSMALLFLSVPMAIYVYGYGNSDGWGLTISASLILLALVYHDRERFTWRDALWLGVLTGLVLLSKRPFWLAIPLAYTILAHKFYLWRHEHGALRFLAGWLPIVLVTTFLLILPQKIIYPLSQGDYAARVLEMREQRAWPELRPSSTVDHGYLLREKGFPFSRVYTSSEWWRMSYQSLYGYFGYWDLQAPLWAYWGASFLMLVGIVATYIDFLRRRAAYSTLTRLLLVIGPLLSLGILFASLYYSWIFDFQPQGRYLMPALLPLALLVGGAVDDEPNALRRMRWVLWTLLLAMSFYTLWELVVAAPLMRH